MASIVKSNNLRQIEKWLVDLINKKSGCKNTPKLKPY